MAKHPRRWIQFDLIPYPAASPTVYRWASRPMAGTFFVEGRISAGGWESITRRASSSSGEYHIDSASIVIEDKDGLVRSLLADATTQWFKNREGAFNLLSDTAFAAGLTPRLLFGGKCYDVQLQGERKARMEFEDVLAPFLDRTYPQYTIGDAYPYRFEEQDDVDEDLHEVDPGLQIPIALRDQVLPIYYGPFVDSALDPITGLARGKGMCPTYAMGYTFLTSGGALLTEPSPELAVILTGHEANWGGWVEFLVCLGEVDIPNVYYSDLGENPVRIVGPSENYGITVLAPGHTGWPFPTDYVMRNGFRCTVIYLRGPIAWHHLAGIVNVTVDVCGWKNSDGDAIDQAGFALQSFLSEHVLAHDGAGYTEGPEAGLPEFSDGRAMIWTSKVEDWQAMTATRLGTTKGYLCSMALTEPTTLREILRTWCVTFDAFLAKNGAGQLYPFSIDDTADVTDGVPIRERMELTGLPAPRIGWDEIENWIDYTVGWDPEQNTPRTTTLTIKRQTAIDALGMTMKAERELRYTADDATATDAVGRRVIRLSHPPRYQDLPVRTAGVDREIGEQVRVTHRDGFGASGYDLQPFVTLGHLHTGDNIVLESVDVARILAEAITAPVPTGGGGWDWDIWP